MKISSEKKLQTLSAAIPDFQIVVSSDGVVLESQAGTDGDLFFSDRQIINKKLEELLATEVSDQYLYFLGECLKKKEIVTCEHKSGLPENRRTYEARFAPFDEGAALILIRDVTNSKKADAQISQMMVSLEESFDNMISILNQLSIGTAMTDKVGAITFLNAAARKLLKLDDKALHQIWSESLPFSATEITLIRRMNDIAPRNRMKVPVHAHPGEEGESWLDVELRDHPQDSHKKIFLFHDVSEVHRLKERLNEKGIFHGMIGQSQVMQEVFHQVRELAGLDVTVLVQGASGTGKELVARALHNLSDRATRPFIAVNCAGLTSGSLLASQLFGHRKGAFTGAIEDQKGLIEAAHEGTLFLDEIGDIPPDVQTSLLRFLQEREITRLGESKPRKINVRIIAASQYDLKTHVDKGSFRLDLYYRIHVAKILIPALSERREDIPLLANYFLARARQATGKEVVKFSSEALQALVQYSFPGNVRELAALVEAAVIRAREAVISKDDLPENLVLGISEQITLDEKQRIATALKQCRGNRSEAARILGMSRATFYRRLDEYRME